MSEIKRKSNLLRRKIMRNLTRNTGKSSSTDYIPSSNIKKVLIVRPNHRLGNMLLVTPIVQEVHLQFPEAEIHLFAKGGAAYPIFQEYKSLTKIISLPKKTFKHLTSYVGGWRKLLFHNYDLVINVIPFSSSGRLATKFARAKYRFFGESDPEKCAQLPHAKQQALAVVYGFREFLKNAGITPVSNSIPLMDIKVQPEEREKAKKILREITQNDRKSIAIFTYATGEKCFTGRFWLPFYENLKKTYPDYNIVEVLPVENISQIGFKAPSFYSKDLREIAAFISNCQVFIGADSGMMHLASASLTPTVGLFSVTDSECFEPYGNGSKAIYIKNNQYGECLELCRCILRDFSSLKTTSV